MFVLGQPDENGVPLRKHLEQVEAQTGVTPRRLQLPEFPSVYLWHWHTYIEISQGRSQNGWGPTPLSWLDLHAWSTLSGVRLSSMDLQILRALDDVQLEVHREHQDKMTERRAKKSSGGGHPSEERVVKRGGGAR